MPSLNRVALVCAALTFACSDPPPRVVTLGDSVSSSPTHRESYAGLLATNDDRLFPAFAGKDLTTKYGATLDLVRLDRGGDSYHSLANGDSPLCTCSGEACAEKTEPCLDTSSESETTVIIELGGNDLLSAFVRLLGREELRRNPSSILTALEADVEKVFAFTADRALFETAPKVFVLNAYDPSDGVGDIAEIASGILPPSLDIDVTVVSSTLALSILGGFNEIIARRAAAIGATVVDTHDHFLGHGYHFDDASHPNHSANDETQWIRGIFDPTLRGAHELRRLVYRAITGEAVEDLPTNLPSDSLLGLPEVPANGWAKAVVASDITNELYSPATDVTWPNQSNDPNQALGPPDLSIDGGSVAVGVLGAFLILDLGESTLATDGEGDDLVILEQGSQSAGVPEPYRVSVADEKDGPFVTIADGRGERSFDLGTAGITKARFVKIESLATAGDVLGGVGSPLAPGPEIDAVGAVHPGAP
jgi:hypothetical protein